MQPAITFLLDGTLHTIDFSKERFITPTTTVLNYLRSLPQHKGVKEGCAEGDCGACTVVIGESQDNGTIKYRSVDSCLVFLPMLHGKQLITVEDLKTRTGELHPVQQSMVETDGSQCGYCTPGFIMSMFSLYKNVDHPSREQIDDALTGNLCRCTGYRPIVEAAAQSCVHGCRDQFTNEESNTAGVLQSISRESIDIHTGQQRYRKPASLPEAISLKHQCPDTLVISGATDIALRVTKRHEVLEDILDLSDLDEMKEIIDTGETLAIGASASLHTITETVKKNFPALYDMLTVFGSQQIRNLATLGGNLGTASPIGDTLPVLMAYGANIVLESLNGRREIPFDQFITGYRKTVRKPDELITKILIPKLRNGAVVKSYKISKRKDLDISTVSAGFRLDRNDSNEVNEIILAYGGMAERTKRAQTTEKFLKGKPWKRAIVEEAMAMIGADFSPISDARAGAEFRSVAAKNLLLKFWSETQ